MAAVRALIVGWLFVIGCALGALSPSAARAQVLDQMRHDIHDGVTPPPAAPAAPPSTPQQTGGNPGASADDGNSDSADDDDLEGDLALVGLGAAAITAPFWAPYHWLSDDYSTPAYFLRYPYWHDLRGSMFTLTPDGGRDRTWQTELGFEYADSFDDLTRLGGHFRLSTTSRFDLETNWNTLWEPTPHGNDSVALGDVDLLYRFAQSEKLQFRSGLGANWFDDHQGVVAGFNFRYGADYFPRRPWHLTALMDLGEIGKAGLFHFRTTAGLMYARWEIYTGYDFRKIGSVEFDGPVAGVEFRF